MDKKLSVVVGQKVYIIRHANGWVEPTYYQAIVVGITPAGFIDLQPLNPRSMRFRLDGFAQGSGSTYGPERIDDEMPFDERRELIRKRNLVRRANNLIEATYAFPPVCRPTQENVTQRIIDMRAKLDEAAAEIAKIEGK